MGFLGGVRLDWRGGAAREGSEKEVWSWVYIYP